MTDLKIKEPKTLKIAGEDVTFPQLPLGKFLEAQKLYYQILSPILGIAKTDESDGEVIMDSSEVMKALPQIMQEQPELIPKFMAASSDKDVKFWIEKTYMEEAQEAFPIIITQNDFNVTLMNSLGGADEKPREKKKTASSQ